MKKVTGTKGFSIIELMVVISIMNILASIAIVTYGDYTKKARIAEIPPMLKSLAIRMIEYAENADAKSNGNCENVDSNGQCQNNYPNKIEDTGFFTSNGTVFGTYFEYKIKSQSDCSLKHLNRFAYAIPIVKTAVPEDYQYSCMNERFDFFHGSKSSDGGNDGNNGNDNGNNGNSNDNGNNGNGNNNGNNGNGNGNGNGNDNGNNGNGNGNGNGKGKGN